MCMRVVVGEHAEYWRTKVAIANARRQRRRGSHRMENGRKNRPLTTYKHMMGISVFRVLVLLNLEILYHCWCLAATAIQCQWQLCQIGVGFLFFSWSGLLSYRQYCTIRRWDGPSLFSHMNVIAIGITCDCIQTSEWSNFISNFSISTEYSYFRISQRRV